MTNKSGKSGNNSGGNKKPPMPIPTIDTTEYLTNSYTPDPKKRIVLTERESKDKK